MNCLYIYIYAAYVNIVVCTVGVLWDGKIQEDLASEDPSPKDNS